MKITKERVIFRYNHNQYVPNRKEYLCIYPDDPANPGHYLCTTIWRNTYGKWTVGCHCEGSQEYFYSQKIIHKNEPIVSVLLNVLKDTYGHEFEAVERVYKRRVVA